VSQVGAERLGPLDTMFLYGEGPDTMMHVASLMTFALPEDASPTYLRDLVDETCTGRDVQPPWNRKLRDHRLLASPIQSWVTDERIDLDYHVRRSALASPGGERELGVLVSRLHSHQLDFSRPPWELHIIEGLEGGRFALYVKIHHALVDGYTAMKLLQRGLSPDPHDRVTPLFFAAPAPTSVARPDDADGDGGFLADLETLTREVGRQTRSALNLGRRLVEPLVRRNEFADLVATSQAPYSILNQRVGRNRRFATQQFSLPLLKDLGRQRGATLNDVLLTIIGGGLRTWLDELGELPDTSLVAFLPVNVRPKDDPGGGNAVGALLARMGTDIEDPVARLEAVTASTRAAKAQLQGMTKEGILAYSGFLMAPSGLQALGAMAGLRPATPLTFNVTVSNVPGPREPLHLRGSRLEAWYPVSIPGHGFALNVTIASYADTANLGFVGDRDALPRLQRLAVHTGDAMRALERALGG
jgi:WS/DGAT/MGAT family acyltransferase